MIMSVSLPCGVRRNDHLCCHVGPFQVVFVGMTGEGITSVFVYKSATVTWKATVLAQKTDTTTWDDITLKATAFVGSSLFFRTIGRTMLRYDFSGKAERLSFIDMPSYNHNNERGVTLMPTTGDKL